MFTINMQFLYTNHLNKESILRYDVLKFLEFRVLHKFYRKTCFQLIYNKCLRNSKSYQAISYFAINIYTNCT